MSLDRFFAANQKRFVCFLLAALPQMMAGASSNDRVLIVGLPGQTLVQKVKAALEAHGKSRRPGMPSAIEVDVRVRLPGQSNADFVRKLQPPVRAYKAAFAGSMGLARALQLEDAAVPLVFHGEADPVELCLVDSMHRPGRNATGYVDYLTGDDEKLIEMLVDAFPALRIIYFGAAGSNYYMPDCAPAAAAPRPETLACVPGLREPDAYINQILEAQRLVEHGRRAGIEVKFLLLCRPEDFALVGELGRLGARVGFVFSYQGLFAAHAERLIDQVALARKPAIFGRARFAKLGGVMALEPIRDSEDEHAVIDMLIQVVDGRSPKALPVQVPRGFYLTVNAAAAAAQGLRPSLKILRRADKILLSNELP